MPAPGASTDRQTVEIGAVRALSGADSVRRRLLSGLAMGTPPVDAVAYVVKSRVKDHESLVLKVLDRRRKDPTYTAKRVTDIVGLRLLTLFRNQLPVLLKHFLYFVEWAQKEPFNLFWGDTIHDAVHEVIIYTTSDLDDVNIELYLNEFQEFGFAEQSAAKKGFRKPFVQVRRKDTQYSSIHIVLWATGVKNAPHYRVPVEVQLRTSLEDVWGEIDHLLKYKQKRHPVQPEQAAANVFYKIAESHLKNLKKNLDVSSATADLIDEQFRTVFDAMQEEIRLNRKSISIDVGRLAKLNLVPVLQQRLNVIVADLSALYASILDPPDGSTKDEFAESAFRRFGVAAAALETCLHEYCKSPSPDNKHDAEVRFRLRMEKALCEYWRAVLATRFPAEKGGGAHSARRELNKSLRQYFQLSRDSRFSSDAVLAFRTANALTLRDSELALDKYRHAVSLLADSNLSAQHYMRMRIPRQLGVALWERAERLRRQADDLVEPHFFDEERQRLYLDALDTTKNLYGAEMDEGAFDRSATTAEEENRITTNNVLAYVISYLRAGGQWQEVEGRGITREKLKEFLAQIVADGIENISRPTIADTARAAAAYLGDRPLAVAAARRVLELIDAGGGSLNVSSISYHEMRRDALSELEPELDGTQQPFDKEAGG